MVLDKTFRKKIETWIEQTVPNPLNFFNVDAYIESKNLKLHEN